jgi:hypothetical protein
LEKQNSDERSDKKIFGKVGGISLLSADLGFPATQCCLGPTLEGDNRVPFIFQIIFWQAFSGSAALKVPVLTPT